ncbi:hypothetical protein L3X38_007474 [Prunus dulcis]|uniref:Uncharacterized protein n=1 Tax=Prunus dulcis TaxID=3755 RepID=A0AAD4ZUT1_PRUDU|nr:hypothetical protein L3X38_007474 [Prunus dulcis]
MGFGAGMEDSPPTGTGTGIPRNRISGDGFGDGGGDEERGWRWYCYTRPLPDPLPSPTLSSRRAGKVLTASAIGATLLFLYGLSFTGIVMSLIMATPNPIGV